MLLLSKKRKNARQDHSKATSKQNTWSAGQWYEVST
nr:MAG TPA: hypothetical protein [Caudoviricetes sp.]